MRINYKRLIEGLTRENPEDRARARAHSRQMFAEDKQVRENFDFGGAWRAAFGDQSYFDCRFNRGQGATAHQVMEAAGAVTTAAFQTITQQFAYSTYLEAYNAPELVVKPLIPTKSTPFRSEVIPGISNIGDKEGVVGESEAYPIAGVSEDYVTTPDTLKKGLIIPATWEAFFFDRTGLVRDRLQQIGTWDGVNQEKDAIAALVDSGESATRRYRYRWLGNTIATYGDSSGTHDWDNLAASNTFQDYNSLKTAWTLAQALTDPFTGEPIFTQFKHLVLPPALTWIVPFVTQGQVKQAVPGFATSGNPTVTETENPAKFVLGNLQTVSSQLIKSATSSDSTWFVGDITKMLVYMENLAPEVTSAPAGSEAEFMQDIIFRIKVRRMGTYATVQPRAMIKCT